MGRKGEARECKDGARTDGVRIDGNQRAQKELAAPRGGSHRSRAWSPGRRRSHRRERRVARIREKQKERKQSSWEMTEQVVRMSSLA